MARTATITTDQILEAARAVFLERGVNATTVEVANRAGISSASIFKRYPTKEALFMAAMAAGPTERIWTREFASSLGHGDTRGDLERIARRLAEYVGAVVPRQVLLRSLGTPEALPEPPRVAEDFAELAAYFGREMGLGRMARGDPTVPAAALLHAVGGFALSQALEPAAALVNTQRFLQDFVTVLWQGLEPKGG